MMRQVIVILAAVTILAACSEDNGVKEKVKSNIELRQDMLAQIDSLESVMRDQDLDPDSEVISELLRMYLKFAELFPGDKSKSPEYLYKAAGLSRSVDLPAKAIKLYDQILNRYPNWEKAPETAFQIAFTYDEDLEKMDLAKEAYRDVIVDFPGDHWAVQAEQRLAIIDLSEEELIEFLKEKSAEGNPEAEN